MKCFSLLAILLVLLLACSLVEPKRKTGGSSRKSTNTGRRPTSTSNGGQNYGHSDLASLSYPGYNSAPKKPQSSPDLSNRNTQTYGWNTNSAPKQEVAKPVQNSGGHSYPSSGGLSGNGQPSYPSSGGLSGNGQPAYPSSGGLSGNSVAKPNTGNSYPSNSASGTSGQHAYPQSPGLSGNQGSGQHSYPQNQGSSGQHVQSSNVNPNYNNPYNRPVNNAQPPPYSAGAGYGGHPGYGGQQGYGGHPPPYGSGVAGYGGHPPQYGGYGGYGGHGGYGGYGGGFPGYSAIGSSGGFGGFAGLGNQGYKRNSGFLSSNTFGAILAGLAVWNLVRSGSRTTNNYYYYGNENNKDDPKALPPDPIVDQLVNCTLTINNNDKTEVTLIPCVIVSSFALQAESTSKVADTNSLNCLITLIFKNSTEKMVNMPCAELSNRAPKENSNQTNCDPQSGNCTPVAQALYEAPPLSVIPLSKPTDEITSTTTISTSTNSTEQSSTPVSTTATSESMSTTEMSSSTSTTASSISTEASTTSTETPTTKQSE